jgi:hypothetical protein
MQIIKAADIWQTTKLDRIIATEFFGWAWYAFEGIPVRETPGYPKECRVRQFFPPLDSVGPQYQRYMQEVPHEPADGSEPLSYRYCSSVGPHMVPHFSGHAGEFRAVIEELKSRGALDSYFEHLGNIVGSESLKKIAGATLEQQCVAALAAIGSKYVTIG